MGKETKTVCKWCDAVSTGRRRHARFCPGSRCRVALHRATKRGRQVEGETLAMVVGTCGHMLKTGKLRPHLGISVTASILAFELSGIVPPGVVRDVLTAYDRDGERLFGGEGLTFTGDDV